MKNKELIGQIIDFDYKGMGMTKLDDIPVFLDKGVIGDKVSYTITKDKKSFYKGRVTKILKKSKDRVESPCKYFNKCGGCDFLNYKYEKSLDWKKQSVNNKLQRISELDIKVSKVNSSEKTFNYRNNMQFQVKNGKIGLYMKNSKEIVPIEHCLMQSTNANKTLKILTKFKNLEKIKTLGIRTNYKDQVMLIISSKEKINKLNLILGDLIDANVVSIYENINNRKNAHYGDEFNLLYGQEYLEEKINKLYYKLSPASFFQVNREQAENLYNKAMEFLQVKENEKIADLYSGVGTLSLEIASRKAQTLGVEIVEEAIEDARINAQKNKLQARFICGKSEEILEKIQTDEKIKMDKILVDPPRKGMDKKLVDYLNKNSYEKIVYISCNPATLARDLKILKEKYKVEKVEIFDLFPYTSHVEVITLLSKLDPKKYISVELPMDDMDLTSAESKATYKQIQNYVFKKFGFKVSNLYIAQVKEKCGIKERENYNKPKKEDLKQPICPIEKEEAIKDAFRYFQMI
ncbi:23S rRNA (uracil(1939)-C(5))-methyltransferase RlmD [Peptoniphilus lacrimalis]|uniref:23S rRNA (Uracil-5-)-methyltransferase RumA n=1 Tax=Peptoniphilus lacrimalis 315-B TaxID=596330 RepID=D1VTT0_9FIRM|nr:23S rRNA (uracil(1939)-C(5))-methyltransferase RlmD [Peptoniphilus lacrimalis]EFA90047.1 23S rRNA (uracil-5-)-methyltransferase RumA [Peptoniphilus lacrimalis 315-B]